MRTSACTADVACHQLGEGTDGGRAAASAMMVLSKFGKCWQSTCPALSSNVVPTSFMCVNNSIRSCSFCASFAFDEVAGKRVHDGKQNSNRPSAVAQHSNFNANKPASGDCSVAIATVACIYLGMQPTKYAHHSNAVHANVHLGNLGNDLWPARRQCQVEAGNAVNT